MIRVNRHALDEELGAADRDQLLAFPRGYGDLSGDLRFKGSGRSGFSTHPGAAGQAAERREPLPLADPGLERGKNYGCDGCRCRNCCR